MTPIITDIKFLETLMQSYVLFQVLKRMLMLWHTKLFLCAVLAYFESKSTLYSKKLTIFLTFTLINFLVQMHQCAETVIM